MVGNFSFLQLLSYSYGGTSEPMYIPPEEHDEFISFMAKKYSTGKQVHRPLMPLMIVVGGHCMRLHVLNQIGERIKTKCKLV